MLTISIFVTLLACLCQVSLGFELTILHTNDVHSRIQQTDKNGGNCSPAKVAAGKCFGGVARRMTALNEIRATTNASLLLDAGDQFQGTLWFNLYKGSVSSLMMNELGYDTMALGNHEFDNEISGLLPFLRNVSFPVVVANMDTSSEPKWPTNNPLFSKSHVKTISGRRIGIIGYITTSTKWLSSPGQNILFEDELKAVKAEAARLKALKVDILIAVGHAGIEIDIKLAENVPDLDVVIGGHSNTFLYTGTPPSNEKPFKEYPLVITPRDLPSKKILVVQDYAFGKYLGNLKVTFDDQGEVVSYRGNPVLLNNSYAEDPKILKLVNSYSNAVANFSQQPIGHTHVLLDGQRSSCRVKECNLGNLIADAFVAMNRKSPDSTKWADVAIALVNSGGIRSSVDKDITEQITSGDMLTVLPFGNTADIIEVTGETLRKTLEHSMTQYNPAAPAGRFLQFSGLRVKYDVTKPEGSRLVSATVRCATCRVPSYQPLNATAVYKVLLPSFIANGGDDFTALNNGIITRHPGDTAVSLVTEYIRTESPVVAGLDDRITFVKSTSPPPSCSGSNIVTGSLVTFVLTLTLALFL